MTISGLDRHRGALLVNLGTAQLVQGKVDQGVELFFQAAESDTRTYKVARDQSFALQTLLKDTFAKPIFAEAEMLATTVNPTATAQQIDSLCDRFGILGFVFLSYVHSCWLHLQASQTGTEFSRLLLIGSIRNLAALFEIWVKQATGVKTGTLDRALADRFKNEPWWSQFASKQNTLNQLPSGDERVRQALALQKYSPTSPWLSILISYLARNYTTHQIESECDLAKKYAKDAIGHLISAMLQV